MERDKQTDLLKLADAFFKNLEYDNSCDYGSVGVDCKRPFGNSDVEGDILEIIDWKPEGNDGNGTCYASWQYEYARELYCSELVPFLQEHGKRFIQLITAKG